MRKSHFFALGFVALAVSWFLWSFTQTDPNLLYSWNRNWVLFQNFMWQIPRNISTWWYIGNILASFAYYFFLSKTIPRLRFTSLGMTKGMILLLAVSCLLLALSNNALSHDLYNYMFNAKAVAVYHQDPHVFSALLIAPHDEWLRFMHNVHTTAPYGHFWTYLSVIPYSLGFGRFLPTFFSFKIFMAVGFGLLAYVQWRLLEKKEKILLFILNPLVLIETFQNGHNDVWMMVLAMGSFLVLRHAKKILSWETLVSFLLLMLSTQIKLATVVLIPLWGLLLVKNYPSTPWITRVLRMTTLYWADLAVLLLFLPLFTDRSQQFLSWYLIWPLSFLPFVKSRWIKIALGIFSLSSMLRYVPFLFANGYTDAIQFQMRVITWSAIPLTLLARITMKIIQQYRKQNET